ncbi:hypothetical protein GCM10027275_23400 [Rhabdobacter roseus]|uniref:Uncharacterized protein n=1 Tax=Rhabdobacter roseus TaxID=1655419 RepID=A0A840TWF7_9BACT|nr:hypothetical protein [Rhabdobacter roseus]MBB5284280.1 hypothetical protein [Rhabdobacter roseus]
MTEEEILSTLDNSNDGYYCSFVELGHVYSYLIDSRLNVFRDDNHRWALAIERLGYNPRAGAITLDINYYGNCLTNLEFYNGRPTSYYSIQPNDADNFNQTIDDESLKSDAKIWLVRGQEVYLSHNKQDYVDAGIKLKEYEQNEIRVEEVGRFVVSQNRDLFRATDNELHKSIPADLKKILVLDEWFHKDFKLQFSSAITDDHLRQTYELNRRFTELSEMNFENFAKLFRLQEVLEDDWNRDIWENNRPSSYETWKMLAKVIVADDSNQYKPTLEPNTHWINWPESGSM